MAGDMRTFDIHIGPAADAGPGEWPVRVQVRPDQRRAAGVLRLPLGPDEVARALGWLEQGLLDADYVKTFGAELFAALFAGDVGEVYRRARGDGDRPTRFRLIIDAPEVARVPWELAYDPQRRAFLALGDVVVRDVSSLEAAEPIEVEPPLRVLVVTASPAGLPPLQDWVETGGIREALGALIHRRRAELEVLPHATLERVQNALREAADPDRSSAGGPIDILHFVGHGQYDPAADQAVLLLEDAAGGVDRVDAESLADVVRPHGVKLVFLNACQSVHASAADMARGMAPTLLHRGIPAVIGMQVTVLDAAAVRFARVFYDALADNAPLDVALTEARRVTRGAGQRKADMGIPVCYLRTESGRILKVREARATPLTRGTWRPWLREKLTPGRLAAGAIGALGLAATLLGLYRDPAVQAQVCERAPALCPIPPMSGDLNVAVARFGVEDQGGDLAAATAEADGLARSVHDFLDTELKDLLGTAGPDGSRLDIDIQVRPPELTGRVAGSTAADRGEAARRLAERLGADVVVYGHLAATPGGIRLEPEIYLSERSLRFAEEVAGQHGFGAALGGLGDIERNPIARAELKARLGDRIRALARFVFGLGYFALRRYGEAMASFQAAEAGPGWRDEEGREILYLFMGNAALQLKDLAAADAHFSRALAINREYARARLGLAEVVRQRSSGDCTAERADAAGLRDAASRFRAALDAKDQPALSNVATKATFGAGQADLCLSQAGAEDRWDEARRAFAAVIAEHARGNARVTELAVEARAYLALIDVLTAGDAPDAAASYRAAIAEYERAIALNRELSPPRPEREALYLVWQAWCHIRLGAIDQARAAVDEADRVYRTTPEGLRRKAYETFRAQVGVELGDHEGTEGGT